MGLFCLFCLEIGFGFRLGMEAALGNAAVDVGGAEDAVTVVVCPKAWTLNVSV